MHVGDCDSMGSHDIDESVPDNHNVKVTKTKVVGIEDNGTVVE